MNIKAELQVKEDEILVIASTDAEDRHGEKIMQDGWIVESEDGTVPVFLDHYASVLNTVGRATPFIENGKLMAKIKMSSATQTAKDARALVKDGTINTVSVGFKVLEFQDTDENIMTKQILYEISLVGVEANKEARVVQKSEEKIEKELINIASEDEKSSKTEEKAQKVDTKPRRKDVQTAVGLLQKSLSKRKDAETKTAVGLLQGYLSKTKTRKAGEKN